ncbi:MAG TPA: response regulator [Gammaproteobacteria bacterium]|nr:response regulator [Gammaproteobacteria bacterium]
MEDMEQKSTVFVIDADPIWGNNIRNTLEIAGFQVKVFDSAETFLEEYEPGRPSCLVLSAELGGGMTGLQLQDELAQQEIKPSIIFTSAESNVANSVKAMRAGAVDFLQKPFQDVELLARVQEAIDLNQFERQRHQQASFVSNRIDKLTRREKEVMDLVLEGLTNKEIASMLGLSHRTVELHRSRVMSKMKADSIVHLVKMTSEHQL